VEEGKTLKNRLHLDSDPTTGMRQSPASSISARRVLTLDRASSPGSSSAIRKATSLRTPVAARGRFAVTVMALPEGNELCVLKGKLYLEHVAPTRRVRLQRVRRSSFVIVGVALVRSAGATLARRLWVARGPLPLRSQHATADMARRRRRRSNPADGAQSIPVRSARAGIRAKRVQTDFGERPTV
jgi:hypothetical protein